MQLVYISLTPSLEELYNRIERNLINRYRVYLFYFSHGYNGYGYILDSVLVVGASALASPRPDVVSFVCNILTNQRS